MKRLIITRFRGGVLCALHDGRRMRQLDWDREDDGVRRGDIFRGAVTQVNPNIRAAFIDLGGTNGFLPFAEGRRLRAGEELTLQVEKEAVKTKLPVLTEQLSLPGRYLVILPHGKGVRISHKLEAENLPEGVRELLAPFAEKHGYILRTNAAQASAEELIREAGRLAAQADALFVRAEHSPAPSRLLQAEAPYLGTVRDLPAGEAEEILTDDKALYEELKDRLQNSDAGSEAKLRLYDDPQLPLAALYSVDAEISHALARNVWLKCGGYLVIEPTEAMTVIDVNTGKNESRKDLEETFFRTNLEAADEIAVQLRLRGISGIIVIDFINMKEEEHRKALLEKLAEAVSADPVHTSVEGMTRLGLVEMTRQKKAAPLAEKIPFA